MRPGPSRSMKRRTGPSLFSGGGETPTGSSCGMVSASASSSSGLDVWAFASSIIFSPADLSSPAEKFNAEQREQLAAEHDGDRRRDQRERPPAEHVVEARVLQLTRQSRVVDEHEDEDEYDGQQRAVQDLYGDEQADDGHAGDERDDSAEDDGRRKQREELRGAAEVEVDALRQPEGFGDGIGGRERQHRARQQRRAEQPRPEENLRVVAHQRREGLRRVLRRLNLRLPGDVKRGGGGDDHRDGHQVREDRAGVGVYALGAVVSARDALLDERALLEELHVRRDGRAEQADEDEDVVGVALDRRHEGPARDRVPVGVAHDRRDGVGEEDERHQKEDFLDPLVRAEDDEIPEHRRGERHGQVAADAEEFRGRADADELADDQPAVGDEDDRDGEERPADAEALAYEVEEAAPRRRAQTRAHLLHDRE